MTGIIIGVLVVLVALVFMVRSIKIVNQNEVIMVERLGKFNKEGKSGLHIIVPFLDRVVNRLDLRTRVVDAPPQAVITKDNVSIEIDAIVYYRITHPYNATYQINDVVQAIEYLTATNLRDVIGSLDLDQTLSSRENINTRLRSSLDEATDPWGVKVERVEVRNITPSADIRQSMEKQMRAEREKRAAILTAEGEKQARITEAEGKKEAQILEADAIRESNILKATGEAEAIRKLAEADAARIKFVFDAMRGAKLDDKMLSLRAIQAFEELAKSENKVFIPFESASVMSGFGSIKELFKNN